MRGDEALELWLNGYKLDALSRALNESGTDTQTVMQARLEELYSQYVPVQERININERIEAERLAEERRTEESRRVSAFRVTEHGRVQCFTTDDAPELLSAAVCLRDYLKKQNDKASSFAEQYPRRDNIAAGEYEHLMGERMENTGRVSGVFDIDFEKREFSAVNIMDGWKTYAVSDVSTAAYHAMRQARLSTEQRWERLLDHLDGKEITSAGHLSAGNISFSEEILEMDDGRLNFYIDSGFNVDAVFGTNVCTDENDDSVNIYADYDMEHGQVCDELTVILWRDDRQTVMSYTLNAAEKEVLKRGMDDYCLAQTGSTLHEHSARMNQEENQSSSPTMELTM